MLTETVRADWIRGQAFLLSDHHGFPIVMTQPNGISGADLLPLSLIGCAAWSILAIVQKQRQRVTGFQVTADSERDEAPPWRFRRIRVRYRFTGHDLDSERIRQAIKLTESKYCSVYATLRDAVEIVSAFEVVNE